MLNPKQIDQPALGLNREYLIQGLEQPVVAAYHSYQVDMVVLYGVRRNISELDMKDVLEFEIELAKVKRFWMFRDELIYSLNFLIDFALGWEPS